jgi:hypothetical protein
MGEVCLPKLTYRACANLQPWQPINRDLAAELSTTQAHSGAIRQPLAEYQNPVRNPYPPVPRPPQTQAAPFKRLYQK